MAQSKSKSKAKYSKPASQVDLEARLENENKSSRVLSTSDEFEAPEDDGEVYVYRRDGYIGVDPVYQTYANETEKPLTAEDGPDAAVAKGFLPSKKQQKKSSDSQGTPSGPPSPEQKDKQ